MSPFVFVIALFFLVCVLAKVPNCCQNIQNNTTCRRYCQQLLDLSTSIQQMQQLLTAAEHCLPELDTFWSCLNTSLPVVRQSEVFPGRLCCDLALSDQCNRRCQTAHIKADVKRGCSVSREKALFNCLKNQEKEQCCQQSTSLSCGMVCRSLSLANNPRITHTSLKVLSQHCGAAGSPVTDCMNKQAEAERATNLDNLPCCDQAKYPSCREHCRSALQSTKTEEEIMDVITVHCGSPDIMDSLWQCFLKMHAHAPSNHTPPADHLDDAKLHCCGSAVTQRCRDLCTETYQSSWSKHHDFFSSCSYMQPVSTIEANMHQCLMDVDEPCQLGCNGLTFCTNFNNRPTELFRSCNRNSDQLAEKTLEMWENGWISLPQMNIPVLDVRTCEPERWKAIACAFHIKPCLKQTMLLPLCKEDCIKILNQCLDLNRLTQKQSVPQLCNPLPSNSTAGACSSLDRYLKRSPYSQQEDEVTHPCRPNPCRRDQFCEIRRRKCKHPADNCQQFICKEACMLGEVSSVVVPRGAYIRIPDTARSSESEDCFLGCRCDSSSKLEQCRPMECLQRRQCMLGTGNKQEHGSTFLLDNVQCICHDGDLLCSRQTCPAGNQPAHLTGSSSECSTQYKPVCGGNGQTYPNNCFAKCAGVTRLISATACSQYDPCHESPCGSGQKCVARRQVCLGKDAQDNCPQYECISGGNCNAHNHDAVCDTTGEEFSNACLLYSHNRNLGYRGHCQDWCDASTIVCGHNGETYSSECAARAAGITVDYKTPCRAVGNLSKSVSYTSSCAQVQCPPLKPVHCRGIVPPGACCPICAAQMRALYNRRLLDIASKRMDQGRITVQQIVQSLSRLLMIAQCHLFGYESLDGDIIFLVSSITPEPSEVQVEACNSEAERLETLIANGSPTLTLYLHLSPLLLAPARRAAFRDSYNSMYNIGSAAPTPMKLSLAGTWSLATLTVIVMLWQ